MTIVAIQAKIWIADGITIIRLAAAKKTIVIVGEPGREHVVRPDAEADERDEQLGERDQREGTIRRRAKVGMIEVAIPNAGRMMM